jgi:hypothetical protein
VKTTLIALAMSVAAVLPLSAQQINLDFPELAAKASETVDVTLDGSLLQLASGFLSKNDVDERQLRDMVQKLEGIYVRSYTFDREGEYDMRFADRVRSQIGPTWKKIVNVQKKDEKVEIYLLPRGNSFGGMVVIAAEPKEFTVVNIVGPISIEQLSSLEGQFGIPKVDRGGRK